MKSQRRGPRARRLRADGARGSRQRNRLNQRPASHVPFFEFLQQTRNETMHGQSSSAGMYRSNVGCYKPGMRSGSLTNISTGIQRPWQQQRLPLPAQVGGTVWLWARAESAETVDVLFIDEAGQLTLAEALAVAQAGKSIVLLGDPNSWNSHSRCSPARHGRRSASAYLVIIRQCRPKRVCSSPKPGDWRRLFVNSRHRCSMTAAFIRMPAWNVRN